MADLQSLTIDDTGELQLPVGTTAQRPGSPAIGYTRYNSNTGDVESYDGSNWIGSTTVIASGGTISTYTLDGVSYREHKFTSSSSLTVSAMGPNAVIEVMVVAGGGGGGDSDASSGGGGGGGGGGVLLQTITTTGTRTVTVGAGGAKETTGSFSRVGTVGDPFANGGGHGSGSGSITCEIGGSGGGGMYSTNASVYTGSAGILGQGFAGGSCSSSTGLGSGAGGGGATQVGSDGINSAFTTENGGDGGDGIEWPFRSTNYYGGGGGGGAGTTGTALGGTGGTGGGANGGNEGQNAPSGSVNTGGGGGGGGGGANKSGGAGGSGIVIARYRI